MKTKLNHIFYIYSEASTAVFFAVCSLVELLCFAYFWGQPHAIIVQWLSGAGAAAFALIASSNVLYIYRKERV